MSGFKFQHPAAVAPVSSAVVPIGVVVYSRESARLQALESSSSVEEGGVGRLLLTLKAARRRGARAAACSGEMLVGAPARAQPSSFVMNCLA